LNMTGNVSRARALKYGFESFARALFRVYLPLDITATERLPSESFLLCSNHTSHLDSVALMVAAGLPFDSFHLLAAADYFDPLSSAGRLTRGVLNIIGIDRFGGPWRGLEIFVFACALLPRRWERCCLH